MKTVLQILILVGVAVICYFSYSANQRADELQQQTMLNTQQIDVIKQATQATLEADVANLAIDSAFYDWQGRYWTTKDAFILNKMAIAASNKASNLKQALQTIKELDSLAITIVKPTMTFTDDSEPASQVSFKNN